MKKIKLLITVLTLFLTTACTTIAVPQVPPSTKDPLEAWTSVLENYVNDKGQVDFISLNNDLADLHIYVNYISTANPANFVNDNERLAHYINAYNAMAMFGVIEAGLPKTNDGAAKVNFFYLKRYVIDGETQSLYAYEEKIRKLGDPRVHFVLNCMSVGCPVLPKQPFRGGNIQESLAAETLKFFADPSKLRIDSANKVVHLSEILDFYTDEFVAYSGSLLAFVNEHGKQNIPEDFAVEYIPYDWTFNQSP